MSSINTVKFNNKQREFFKVLHQRVDQYFKSNSKTRFGEAPMIIKAVLMHAFYFVPYFLMLFGVIEGNLGVFLSFLGMGLGMAGIGLGVMHDANHGSMSRFPWLNKIFAHSLNIVGGHTTNWQLQHNHLHHTFTNVDGHDEDIAPVGILRFSPHAPLKKIHRFQFIYAWFFYGMMTMMWITTKDFNQIHRYKKMGLLKMKGLSFGREYAILITTKLAYYAYAVLLPFMFFQADWWVVLTGFVCMHFLCGFILACIFQPAHVVEDTKFPKPDPSGNLETDWSVHQLFTTANYAPKNWLLSWYVGGLNYQVEHHLFPAISHVHYRKLAPIVQQTAREFNLPYHTNSTFVGALWSHTKMLWNLGRA